MRFNIKISHITSILLATSMFTACTTYNNIKPKTRTNHLNKSQILENVRNAIDPQNQIKDFNTIQVQVSIQRVYKDLPSRVSENFLYCNDKALHYRYLRMKKCEMKGDNISDEATIEGIYDKNKYETKMSDNIEELSEFLQNTFPEKTKNFFSYIFFGLFDKPMDYKVSSRKVKVNNKRCYKMLIVLNHRYIDSSNKLIYYIDDKDFLVQKIETDYTQLVDVQYKNINGINVFHKLKIINPYTENIEVSYYELQEFSLNKNLKFSDNFLKAKAKKI